METARHRLDVLAIFKQALDGIRKAYTILVSRKPLLLTPALFPPEAGESVVFLEILNARQYRSPRR